MKKEHRSRRQELLREAWFDRDLSWLEFNRRVLSQALDERTPLLERLKFLAIFTSNLDEFFMKRVGAMRTRAYASGNIAVVEEFNAHTLRLRAALYPLLLRRAEAVAAQQRASMLWLTAWVGNRHALAFYARRGYRDVGATVYRFQDEQYENRVLTRALDAPAAAVAGK